jgi:hypothetical protein
MKKITVTLTALLFLSCNEDFSPNGEYTPKLIVYSVLDAAADTQYVRVYSSYSPEQYAPNAPSPVTEIPNAVVRVYDDSSEYIFTDTLITIPNGSSTSTIRVYKHPAFRPKDRKLYHLSVRSGTFPEAVSTATGMEAAQIIFRDSKPLFEPVPGKFITFDCYMGRNIGAYLPVLKLEYEILKSGIWIQYAKEVPIDIVLDPSGNVTKRFYPIPILYEGTNVPNRLVYVSYTTEIFSATVREIKEEHAADYEAKNLRFKDIRFTLVQFNNELFTYYSVANNFPGAATIRLDEPDYSNITNGYGIFGTMSTQVKVYGTPGDYP